MKTILTGRRHGKVNWETIAGQETTTSDQLIIRGKLMETFPVNDTWAEVHLISAEEHIKGRLRFLTAKDAADNALANKKSETDLENSRAMAEERARKLDEDRLKTRQELHEAEVAGLNKHHDAIRSQISPVSSRAQRIIDDQEKQLAREMEVNYINELSKKSDEELLALFNDANSKLPEDKRVKLAEKADKAAIVKAILSVKDASK